MNCKIEKANLLRKLHIKGDPLILYNIWDAGSAVAVAESGAKVIATSSWAVAASQGYLDGERLPFDLVVANAVRILSKINMPLSLDIEGGYAKSVKQLQENIKILLQLGVVGINFEDQIIDGEGLYSIDEQCARIAGIRMIAENAGVSLFINARTDLFFKSKSAEHNEQLLQEAILRASAYASSGADGFFVPGLQDKDLIQRLCNLSPIPINIMVANNDMTVEELSELGVARISYGPIPYLNMISGLKNGACLNIAKDGLYGANIVKSK